jgi:hypothetical protein
LTLLARVVSALEKAGIPHAAIGAAVLPTLGVVRSTVDLDLLTMDLKALVADTWQDLLLEGLRVEVRRGDVEDPLAGVVRFAAPGHQDIDLVVGRHAWQARAIERAQPLPLAGSVLPVVQGSDLILLKLYAGGPQDAWDIQQALAGDGSGVLAAAVERDLPDLPVRCRQLWESVKRR